MQSSQPQYNIRLATLADQPSILEIYNDAVLGLTASYDYEPRSMQDQNAWFQERQSSGWPVLVATPREHADRVLGWGALSQFRPRPGYRFTGETTVYVHKEVRGRGLGGLILPALVEAGRQKGLHALIAAVDADNFASLRIHERCGFEIVGGMHEIGRKFDRWLDITWLQMML